MPDPCQIRVRAHRPTAADADQLTTRGQLVFSDGPLVTLGDQAEPNLPAGGHRCDPGTLHSPQTVCQRGFAAHASSPASDADPKSMPSDSRKAERRFASSTDHGMVGRWPTSTVSPVT